MECLPDLLCCKEAGDCLKNQNIVFATGKSILKCSSTSNIGALVLEDGGGGHENAGTCQVSNDIAGDVLGALSMRIVSEG